MKKYRLGLVGCGKWGQNYIKTINTFSDIELIALYRQKNIRPHNISDGCKLYYNGSWGIPNNLNGIIIAIEQPYFPALNFNDNNIPILAEKPFITHTNYINNLNFKKIMVNYTHLYSDPFQEIKKIIGNNKITRIYSYGYGPSETRKLTSPLFDYGVHDLSMILSLVNKEPNDVYIKSKNKTSAGETFYINLTFNDLKTTSVVGNGTLVKGRYLYVSYEDNNQINTLVYDDLTKEKLFLNDEPVIYQSTGTPLENSIKSFLNLIDGKKDERHGIDLTTKITKILGSYAEP